MKGMLWRLNGFGPAARKVGTHRAGPMMPSGPGRNSVAFHARPTFGAFVALRPVCVLCPKYVRVICTGKALSTGTRLIGSAVNITGVRNPYDYANAVRTDEYFAGRGAELDTINYVLGQSGTTRPVVYLALHGMRAAGKTSLLNMTEKLAEERGYLVVRVNLVPANSDPARFFVTVYEELIGAVAMARELASPGGLKITPRVVRRIIEGGPVEDDFPLEFPENLAHALAGGQMSEMALRNDLRRLMELVGRPIVLLIDEAQLIAGRPDVLSMLRTLGMRLEGYVLVLAGTPELVARINEVFDFLLRQFEFIKVERFVEVAEVAQCMTRPLEAIDLNPERCFVYNVNDVAYDLMRLTDGNPYEIQLFCHVLFTRWQTGRAAGMDLTAQAIDDVRAALEIGSENQDHPLANAVRRMSDEELLALNIWCSSLEHATVDEIRFAYRVSGLISLDADSLDSYLDQFVRNSIIELIDDQVRLIGDTAEHIYARLSTVQRLGGDAHILISRVNFRNMLTGELADLLRDQVLGGGQSLLRTCCAGMRPEFLAQGVQDLTDLPTDRRICHTVEYLHEAMLDRKTPQSLHLSTVECSYGATTATRWIAATDDFDLNAETAFQAAQERIAVLGGILQVARTTIPLRPMVEIVDWLVDGYTDLAARSRMAARHVHVAYAHYEAGDIAGAFVHLDAAFRLSPGWLAANNVAYLQLVTGDYPATRDWAHRAMSLGISAKQRSLSRYNGAIAALLAGDWAVARELLADATTDLAHPSPHDEDEPDVISYLMIPTFEADHVTVHEGSEVNLPEAIAEAGDMVELGWRLERLGGSA